MTTTLWRSGAFKAVLTALMLVPAVAAAQADPIADFYKGKTVNVLIGVGVGGEYDLHARLVARYIGKHIPGNPSGAAEHDRRGRRQDGQLSLQTSRPRTARYIGMIANNFPAQQAIGADGHRLRTGKFGWIGSISPTVETMTVWKTAGVSTLEEAREGSRRRRDRKGAITSTFPGHAQRACSAPSSRSSPAIAAATTSTSRWSVGRSQARNNTWSSWKVTKPDWLRNGDIMIIVYAGPTRRTCRAFPSVTDSSRTDDDRRIVELIVSGTRLGRPLSVAAPAFPPTASPRCAMPSTTP